jgi:hypothetical protein
VDAPGEGVGAAPAAAIAAAAAGGGTEGEFAGFGLDLKEERRFCADDLRRMDGRMGWLESVGKDSMMLHLSKLLPIHLHFPPDHIPCKPIIR